MKKNKLTKKHYKKVLIPEEANKTKLFPTGGNDEVMTPDSLAISIVRHFRIQVGEETVCEPCYGNKSFLRAFTNCGILADKIIQLEINDGLDFFEYKGFTNWIITNPPWSLTRRFLKHSYETTDNVVYLITINHILGLRARLREMEEAGFGVKEVLLCETPTTKWPQSGFQLGVVHLKRGYKGPVDWSHLDETNPESLCIQG